MSRRDDLTALVGTRICHDLVNPLGAISNGVELMGLAGTSRSPELDLIEESVQSASARIRFFRLAYGSGDDEMLLGRSDIVTTLQAVAKIRAHQLLLDGPGGSAARPCSNHVPATAMHGIGDADGRRSADREAEHGAWQVTAEAERFIIDEPLWDSLSNPRARVRVSAAQVQFALLAGDLSNSGSRMSLKITPTKITARF